MKKSLPILLASFLMGAGLSACSAPSLNNDKIEIVTTIFPEYDWTREILLRDAIAISQPRRTSSRSPTAIFSSTSEANPMNGLKGP